MEDFMAIMSGVLGLFKLPISIYGFQFSLWDVMLISILAYILLRFIVGLFDQ